MQRFMIDRFDEMRQIFERPLRKETRSEQMARRKIKTDEFVIPCRRNIHQAEVADMRGNIGDHSAAQHLHHSQRLHEKSNLRFGKRTEYEAAGKRSAVNFVIIIFQQAGFADTLRFTGRIEGNRYKGIAIDDDIRARGLFFSCTAGRTSRSNDDSISLAKCFKRTGSLKFFPRRSISYRAGVERTKNVRSTKENSSNCARRCDGVPSAPRMRSVSERIQRQRSTTCKRMRSEKKYSFPSDNSFRSSSCFSYRSGILIMERGYTI